MNDTVRFKLRFGPCKTPRIEYRATVLCDIRGKCVITGKSDGRIPWPVGRPKGTRNKSLIVYRCLVASPAQRLKSGRCFGAGI